MKNRNTAIIITVAVVLICACLPLCLGVAGGVDWMWGADWFGLGDSAGTMAIAGICLSFLGVIVAIVIGIVTLRKKPDEIISAEPIDQNLPPTI